MAELHIPADAVAIAHAAARDAGQSLEAWVTHAIAQTAAAEHLGKQAPVDDGGFPAVILGHALHG